MDSESSQSASRKNKSAMWNFFIKKGADKIICKDCRIEFKYSNNTSNMKDHLKRKHPELLISADSSQDTNTDLNETGEINASSGAAALKYAVNSTRKKMLDIKFTKMVAIDMQPLRLAEHEGLKEFVTALDSKYEMPGRTKLSTKLLPTIYRKMKLRLMDIFQKIKYLAITTDAWTSTSNEGVLAVTGHLIINRRLESVLLAARVVEGHHDADNLSFVIASILEEFKCRSKVVAMVTDNAPVMIKTAEILKIRHLPCFAHSLNLVLKHTILDSECTALKELLDKCKAKVTFFRHSTLATDELKAMQNELNKPQLKLILYVETRWNSSFQMLKRIFEIRDELSVVLSRNQRAPSNLTPQDYNFLEDVVKLFEPIDSCTEAISGETYCTISMIIPLIKGLMMNLAQLERDLILECSRKVVETLKKYCVTKLKLYELRNPCIISTLLNPHFKKLGFKTDSDAVKGINIVQREYSFYLATKNTDTTSDVVDDVVALQAGTSRSEVSVPNKSQKLNLLSYLESPSTTTSNATADAIVEVNHYISTPILNRKEYPIEYWSYSQSDLKDIAYKYLCIPATSTPAERIFSMAGQVIVERRNRLGSGHINELLFIKQNHKLLEN